MKKIFLFALILLLLCPLCMQAQSKAEKQLAMVEKLKKDYSKVEIYFDTFFKVYKSGGYGIFNQNGKEIISVANHYYSIEWNPASKCFEAGSTDKDSEGNWTVHRAAVYNSRGDVIVPCGYYNVKYVKDDSKNMRGYYEVFQKIDGKNTFGYYNPSNGYQVIPPGKYTNVRRYLFSYEFEVTTLDGKMGVFAEGILIPTKYSNIKKIGKVAFVASSNDYERSGSKINAVNTKATLYGLDGKVLVPEGVYDKIYYYGDCDDNAWRFAEKNNILHVFKGGLWEKTITHYRLGYQKNLIMPYGGKVGLIDAKTGKVVFDLVDGSQIDWPEYPNGDVLVYHINLNCDTVAVVHYSPQGKLLRTVGTPIAAKSDEELAKIKEESKKEKEAKSTTMAQNAPAKPKSDADINIPKTDKISPDTYVFIVANENYPQRKVRYAINDGTVFKEYCEKTLGIPANHIRFYPDATSANLLACIEQMKQASIANSGQLSIIFYYAGHAFPDEQTKSAYLLPVDGQTNLLRTCYSLNKLYNELSTLQAKNITCFIDACFSGATRENEMLLAGRGVAIKPKYDVPRGNVVVFTSASGAETAHQYKDKEHGLFTYYLLKKLQESKGNVTLGELGDYITTNVKRTSFDVNDKIQTPTVIPSATMTSKWRNIKL